MKEYTFLDKVLNFIPEKINYIRYRIAKNWLNDNFGYQEYWGNYICELEECKRTLDMQRKATKI